MISFKKLFTPVKSLDSEEAKRFIAGREEGSYTLLDVRQPSEYETEHIPGAKLIPLPGLKDALHDLDSGRPVVAYCAVGGRSRVAAQLLSGLGFKEVYNLEGGVKAWQGQKAAGPRELNLDMVRGDETPVEMIRLAYGMEKALQEFYTTMHSKTEDQELGSFFSKMVEAEESHKKRLFELQGQIEPPGQDLETFEAAIDSQIMEGGFDMGEFMVRNEPFLQKFPDVIDIAMMLETQDLDLYLRFSQKSAKEETKEVLFKIADEEKAHLAALGRLLEEKI